MANDSDGSGYALAGAGLLAGLISSAGQYWATKKTVAQNEKWNKAALAAANTAHQREVADLYAAGLNPILSASSSGASVPALSGADYSNPGEGLSAGINSATKAYIQNRSALSQIDVNSATASNLAAQNKNLHEQNREIQARVKNIEADTALKNEQKHSVRYPGHLGQGLRSIHSLTDDWTDSFHRWTNSASDFGRRSWNYLKEKARAGVTDAPAREQGFWHRFKQNFHPMQFR